MSDSEQDIDSDLGSVEYESDGDIETEARREVVLMFEAKQSWIRMISSYPELEMEYTDRYNGCKDSKSLISLLDEMNQKIERIREGQWKKDGLPAIRAMFANMDGLSTDAKEMILNGEMDPVLVQSLKVNIKTNTCLVM